MYSLKIQGQRISQARNQRELATGGTLLDLYFDLEYLGDVFPFLQTTSVRQYNY
jgi:hypothetical protein